MPESETTAALRRAGKRAGFHLLRAAVEGLKAVEVLVDELAAVGRRDAEDGDEPPDRIHIEIE